MVRTIPADSKLLDAAIEGDASLARLLGVDVVAGWATFREALPRTRDALVAGLGPDWGPRLFISGDPPELVGWGGFKGEPENGVVELGYEIAQSRQDRGLATEAVEAMIAEAFADDRVEAVIAHTLPGRNASNRVLEKTGFALEGEAKEGDRTVWRFRLERSGH